MAVIFLYRKPPILNQQVGDIVKHQVILDVKEIDVYVAPTVINLVNPTFWIQGSFPDRILRRPSESTIEDLHMKKDNTFSAGVGDPIKWGENLLRKIVTVNDIRFIFEFLNENYVDYLNPKIYIDILIEKLNGEMNGANMWHFIYVLKAILFDRGEKAIEI